MSDAGGIGGPRGPVDYEPLGGFEPVHPEPARAEGEPARSGTESGPDAGSAPPAHEAEREEEKLPGQGSAAATIDEDGPDDGRVKDSESFLDDVVGAQAKKTESDQEKISRDRRSEESRRRLANWNKVREASTFGDADGDEARRALGKIQGKRPGDEGLKAIEGEHSATSAATLEQQEVWVGELFEELNTLIAAIDKIGGLSKLAELEQSASSRKIEGAAAQLLSAAARLRGLEGRVRDLLMTLLTGGFGFKLLGDPRLTFRRLFARITRWPSTVPPGHAPATDADFDAFVAWVFQPPRFDPSDLDLG